MIKLLVVLLGLFLISCVREVKIPPSQEEINQAAEVMLKIKELREQENAACDEVAKFMFKKGIGRRSVGGSISNEQFCKIFRDKNTYSYVISFEMKIIHQIHKAFYYHNN